MAFPIRDQIALAYKTVIDNTDGDIQYKGSNWTIVGPFADGYGVPVYNGSQSMAQGAGHEFTYKFKGSAIAMFGSWDYTDNPLPMCEVDGSAISGPTSEEVDVRTHQMHDQADDFSQKLLLATNQMPLCGVDGLQLVEHELVVKTRSDINTRLVFDYLVFTTSSPGYASDRDPGTFTIDADDYTVEYSGEWQSSTGRTIEEVPNLYQNATMASTHNATVMLGFYGSQITMVGILDNTQGPPATGQYTIDGFFSTSFSLSNTVNSRATIFQQTIFTSYRLPLRSHEIVVRWDGDVGQQRLGFTNFYVETVDNPTLNGATTASTISPSSTQSSLTQTPQIHGTPAPVAVIVGGAVGGLVAVTAAIMFLWFLRRRRRITSTSHEHSQPAQVAGPHDDLQRPVQTDPLLGYGVDLFHPPAATPESVWTESSTSGAVTLSVGGTSIQSSLALLKEKQSQTVRVGDRHSNLADSDMVESDRTEFLMHQDSGLRLSANTREGRRVVEVPPGYTA